MEYREFYQQCAIAAMQGLQEANGKIGLIVDFLPKKMAGKAFDIAEAMLDELTKRDNKYNELN